MVTLAPHGQPGSLGEEMVISTNEGEMSVSVHSKFCLSQDRAAFQKLALFTRTPPPPTAASPDNEEPFWL